MTSIHSPGYHVYFDIPTPIFKARVNLASATYPLTVLPFDGVTLGAFGDIIPDMTLVLGTTDGGDDLGRVRVHNVATSSQIPVGRIPRGKEDGTLDPVDNAFITVYNDYRVWPKIPRMIFDPETDEDITTFKDADIPVLSYNDEIPPTANSGPFFADYIDTITSLITVTFPMNGVDISYANAEGATITDYLWDIEDGTLVSGALTDASITATFPAGKRWVGLTVTDSNGKVHTSRTFVLAINHAADLTYKNWANAAFTMDQAGQRLDFTLNTALSRTTYPDGFLVLVWKDAPASPGDRSHMLFTGWHETEDWNVAGRKQGFLRDTTLHCVDVAGKLALLPGFPQALERPDEDDDPAWEYMPDLTMNRVLNYLGAWHTTAWSLADVILPADDDYPTVRRDTGADSIFEQMNSTAKLLVPSHILTCNPQGQLVFLEDWMEIDIGDRPAASLIIQESQVQDIRASYNRQSKAHSLHKGAIQTSTGWVMIGGQKDLPLFFSIAPGDSFSHGTNEVVEGQGLAKTQDDLNMVTGHRFARMNARFSPFDVTFAALLDFWEFAPAHMNRVQLNIGASYAAQRGLPFTQEEGMVQKLTVRLRNGKTGFTHNASLSWEMETSGFPGVTHIPEDTDDADPENPPPVPTEPPGLSSGEGMMAAIDIDGYRYRTFDFDDAVPTWERDDLGLAGCYSWIVDPFSPKYTTDPENGFVNGWVAMPDGIYQIEDLFGETSSNLAFTFPVATVSASFHWRQISASFGAFFSTGFNPWLVCVSYYGSTTGHTGTWATYSTDGGATWSAEVQISEFYALDAPTRFNPIGLYTSPKRPGLAYTVAYGDLDASRLPMWGLITDGSPVSLSGVGASAAAAVHSETGMGTKRQILICAPPANTERMLFRVNWVITHQDNGLANIASQMIQGLPSNVSATGGDASNFSPPGADVSATTSGSFEPQRSLVSGVWTVTKDNVETDPPTVSDPTDTSPSPEPVNWYISTNAAAANESFSDVEIVVTLLEIEFDDASVYTPEATTQLYKTTDYGATWTPVSSFIDTGESLGGTLHFPWPDNETEQIALYGSLTAETVRAFRLLKAIGASSDDISPVSGAVTYGVNRGPFGVRTFDGAGGQQYVLAAAIGNETSLHPDDDIHAVFVSDDSGASWNEVVAPVADASAPTGRPAFEAAFGGTSEQEIFIWGPPSYFGYSDDLGATVQDKSGNLAALGATGFIGIAGGSS
jgi:hypothetical protein